MKSAKEHNFERQVKPHALLDFLKRESELKNDAALSRALKVSPPVISKIRSGRLRLGAELILRIHLLTEMPVQDILDLLKENQDVKDIHNDAD